MTNRFLDLNCHVFNLLKDVKNNCHLSFNVQYEDSQGFLPTKYVQQGCITKTWANDQNFILGFIIPKCHSHI